MILNLTIHNLKSGLLIVSGPGLPEFLKVILETILQENYLIDPQVKGKVTLHTVRPVSKSAVLSLLEVVLQQNGAALIRDNEVFRVVPLGEAGTQAGAPAIGRFPSTTSVAVINNINKTVRVNKIILFLVNSFIYDT